MGEAIRTGLPVNRPILWVDPFDTKTYFIDDGVLKILNRFFQTRIEFYRILTSPHSSFSAKTYWSLQ